MSKYVNTCACKYFQLDCDAGRSVATSSALTYKLWMPGNGITEEDIEFHYFLCQTVCGHCVVLLSHVGSTLLLPIITHTCITYPPFPRINGKWSHQIGWVSPIGRPQSLDIGYKIWKIWNVFTRILSKEKAPILSHRPPLRISSPTLN